MFLSLMSCLASPQPETLSSRDVKKCEPPPMRLPSDLGGNPRPDGPYAWSTNAPSGKTSQPVTPFSAPGFLTRFVLNGVVVAAPAGAAAASRSETTMADEASSVAPTPCRRDRVETTISLLERSGPSREVQATLIG